VSGRPLGCGRISPSRWRPWSRRCVMLAGRRWRRRAGRARAGIGALVAARLSPAGRVLVTVPTLELVAQMLETLGEHGGAGLGRVVAV